MPKSVCSMSPRWMTPRRRRALAALAPNRDRRMEPLAEPELATRCRIHHTTSSLVVLPGVIDLVRERLADDHVRDLHHVAIGFELLGNLDFEPADREHLRRFHARRVLRAERLEQARFSLAVRPSAWFQASDLSMPMTFGFLSSTSLRSPAHCPSLLRRHERVEAVVVEAADRVALDGLPPPGLKNTRIVRRRDEKW